MLRFLLWRLLGLLADPRGPRVDRVVRRRWPREGASRRWRAFDALDPARACRNARSRCRRRRSWSSRARPRAGEAAAGACGDIAHSGSRLRACDARRRRRYVRLRVDAYRTDHASVQAVVAMYRGVAQAFAATLVAPPGIGAAVAVARGASHACAHALCVAGDHLSARVSEPIIEAVAAGGVSRTAACLCSSESLACRRACCG